MNKAHGVTAGNIGRIDRPPKKLSVGLLKKWIVERPVRDEIREPAAKPSSCRPFAGKIARATHFFKIPSGSGRIRFQPWLKLATGLAISIASLTLLCGCTTPGYWQERTRDALDVVTVTIGWGGGAKARVGPAHAGLYFGGGIGGLRGGHWGKQSGGSGPPLGFPDIDFEATVVSAEWYTADRWNRGKCFEARGIPFLSRAKPVDNDPFPVYYYTQVEVAVGLLATVRVGVNPGEFADWLLGFASLDLMSDDLNEKPLQKEMKRVAGRGEVERVRNLLRRGIPPLPGTLHKALTWERIAVAVVLLDAGVDPNEEAPIYEVTDNGTALHAAAARGYADGVALLLKAGASPDAQTHYNKLTPLHVVGESSLTNEKKEYVRTVRLLLEAGADLEARDDHGHTPLLSAITGRSRTAVIEALLDAGADRQAKDNGGRTALDYAERYATPASSKYERILDLLRGAEVNGNDSP